MNKKLEEKAAGIAEANGFKYDDVLKLLECGVSKRKTKRLLGDKKAGLSWDGDEISYLRWVQSDKWWVRILLPGMLVLASEICFFKALSSRAFEFLIAFVCGVCLSETVKYTLYCHYGYARWFNRIRFKHQKKVEFLESKSPICDESLLALFGKKTAARLKKKKQRLLERRDRKERRRNEAETWRRELLKRHCGYCNSKLEQDAATMEINRTTMTIMLVFLGMMSATFVAGVPVAMTHSMPWYSIVIFFTGVVLGAGSLFYCMLSGKSQKRRFTRVAKELRKDAVVTEVMKVCTPQEMLGDPSPETLPERTALECRAMLNAKGDD